MPKHLKTLFKTPKVQMGLFLILIALSAIFHFQSVKSLLSILLAVLSTIISDIIFIKLRKIKPFFPSAAIVTGIIIGLLAYFQLPWYEIITTAIIAMAAKNFLHIQNRHIFNPAGFGLFFSSLIFHRSVSWWGVSFQDLSSNILSYLLLLIIISPGFVSMIRLKRYLIPFSFFGIYILIISIIGLSRLHFNPVTILQITLMNSTIIFFSLVMLPEPMTSPNNPKSQILYGSSVAILAAIFSLLFPNYFPDIFIGALLTGNALFFKR